MAPGGRNMGGNSGSRADASSRQCVSTKGFDPGRKEISLPASAGWCAWDADECWVMVAVDTTEEMRAILDVLKPRHRIRLVDSEDTQ